MSIRNEFTITVACNRCGSTKVEVQLYMAQGSGLLSIECEACPNKPNNSYDDEDLTDSVNVVTNPETAKKKVIEGLFEMEFDEEGAGEFEPEDIVSIPILTEKCVMCLPALPDATGRRFCIRCRRQVQ